MKVICIDATTDPDSELPVDLVEGDVYTVVDEGIKDNIPYYHLQEKPGKWYSQDAFVPLSDIDEIQYSKFTRHLVGDGEE